MEPKTPYQTLHIPLELNVQNIPYKQITMGVLIGHGGYGDVYQATWHGTEVAVKQLHLKTLSPDLAEDFMHEAKIMSQCHFPNILKLYGIWTEVGYNSLILEYMSRGSLRSVLENKTFQLSWTIRWDMALDIAQGLAYLHGKNILHRDLKSLNILLGEDFQAKISDFGLSKIKLGSSSSMKNTAGTVRWSAPEIFKRGYKPNSSMDIYSYGMVLWEIASRSIPFSDAQNEQIVMGWLQSGEKETVPVDCPQNYGQMIESCWLEANQRPTADQVVNTLIQIKPTSAAPVLEPKTYVEKSWHFDPATQRKAANELTVPFQVLEATDQDKRKVNRFYQHHPVPGYEVGSVRVIYNKDFNQGFEIQMKRLQNRHNNPGFAPRYSSENDAQWRICFVWHEGNAFEVEIIDYH